MKSNLENKLIAVVRVRGHIGVRGTLNDTMNRLNLNRVNSLALVYGDKSSLGMIKKVNDFVTYGEIKREVLEKVLEKNGKSNKDDAAALASGKKKAKEIIELPIRLHPPRHGYEGIKKGYSNKGALGYRGEAINELISRMI